MGDVERWLAENLTQTEKDGNSILKEDLWGSFSSYMNVDNKVGRESFFSFLGNALLNVGYQNVTPVYKKGQRRIGYRGLAFKATNASHQSNTPIYQGYAVKKVETLDVAVIQTWMEECYCEGEEDDKIAKSEVWSNFQTEYQTTDEKRPTFFALLGNYVFGRPPFLQVKALKKDGKSSMYQKLRRRSFVNRVHSETAESNGEMVGVDVQAMPCWEEEDAPEDTAAPETSDVDYSSDSLDEDHGPLRQPSKKRRPVLSEDDDILDEDDMHNSLTDVGTDPLDIEIAGDENVDDAKERSGSVPTTARISESLDESEAHLLFKRFHKRMDYLLPSHLPGKPSSFQMYLASVFQDPSDYVVERAGIHSSSAKASNYKDYRPRAFLAATFPPIRVGSLAGEVTGVSFKGDNFPQFTHVTKGNFKCAICIPYLRWAIRNSQPHSVVRSRKATTEAILKGTAELEFSGLVQVQEHSSSKCHLEACQFWKRDKEPTTKPLTKKEFFKRRKTMDDYLVQSSKPLNC